MGSVWIPSNQQRKSLSEMKSLVTCLVFFFITATLAYSSSYEEKSTPEYPAVPVSIDNLNI